MSRLAVFRCDASPEIGGGHVMRSLVLADALAEEGWRCLFAVGREAASTVPALSATAHAVHVIEDGPPASEAAAVGELAEGDADLLVVDHYERDAAFEAAARAWARRVMAIDDLANRRHDCDLLLDQSPGRRATDYDGLVPHATARLIGPDYALLRPAFYQARQGSLAARGANRPLRRVLVSFGMVDGKGMTLPALDALAQLGLPLAADVTLGGSTPLRKQIESRAQRLPFPVVLHQAVEQMAALMLEADLAIGAAGTSALERCCLGLPSLAVVTADNQAAQARALADAGAVALAGRWDAVDSETLAASLRPLVLDGALRAEMALRAFAVCDGNGARRVVLAVAPEQDKDGLPVSLRLARGDDCETLFHWQSAPGLRRWFRNAQAPTWDEHQAWFQQRLRQLDGSLYVVERDGRPVGVVRLDGRDDDRFELSVLVAPELTGMGIGTAALRSARRLFRGTEMVAEVHQDNQPSHKAFQRAGFRLNGSGRYVSAAARGDHRP
ncbi:MAG: UDP-2,4-diacetamido-2,4,6-trideoxy-beta-L-altropyranose hydrolase [Kiloniellales bacterium]